MPNTVTGKFQAGTNLKTKFTTGTAGEANETNNLGDKPIQVGAAQAAGLQFAETWSHTYSAVAAPFDIDLTALTGIGGRPVDFTASGVRLVQVINSDPAAGHDVTIGPAVTNGWAALWPNGLKVHGGMPGAGIVDGSPVGNVVLQCCCRPTALVVDSTHKVLTIDPGANTITSLTILIAG